MELIRKSDALHAVLHNTGDAAVAAVQEIKAVDAVPVVRCEHCKYRGGNRGDIDSERWCYQINRYVELNWYCKDGERKDGEV